MVKEKTYTLGDRVWIDDNKDGLQTEGEKGVEGVTVKLTGEGIEEKTTTTDANGNYKFEGLKNGNYTVTFETPEGYEITKTNEGTDDEKDSDGLEVKATIKDADNMSVDLGLVKKEAPEKPWTPIEETGKFQEHHIYITKDKDGKVIKREVVDGKVNSGTKDKTYTTGKKEKDGFKFVKTQDPKENPSYDKDGKETTGNFVPGKTQEITYVYEKTETPSTPPTPTEETGKFQEHHIYITKDKDGKVIKREVVDGKVNSGTKDKTYTTGKKEKDGFKFVKTQDPKENPSYDKDGKETTGNFVPGKTQEITYVYEKTETPSTPPTPVEPSEPSTPVEPSTPPTPVEPEEPTTPVTPEKPDEDSKETPWTPLTPAEEVTPQTPDDNETPKDEPKETPKEDSKETSEKQTKKQSKKLPKAGADYELLQLAAGALTLVSGMGISLSRKKRD